MNVINDNWLYVRYLDDRVEQISVRQVFIDAEKIKNIETPVFHGIKVYIYDVPIIQFLSILVLAAYFKPETNFKSGSKYFSKELKQSNWDLNLILNYLDKYQDRFNLFDSNYPFLQDNKLKTQLPEKDANDYISKISLVAPAGNNLVFEHNGSNKNSTFIPTLDELIYILLYTRIMGTSPMSTCYPNKSICCNTTMFMINYGSNLKETIIYNCLPLRTSSKDEEFYDRPEWEFTEDYIQLLRENIGDLYKNVLLCTLFPCLPIYVKYNNNEIKNIILSKTTKDNILSKEQKNELASKYAMTNPWAIRVSYKDENTQNLEGINTIIKYKEWTKSLKLISLCIDITKKLPDVGYTCRLLENDCIPSSTFSTIYYRQYDGMKSNVLSFGKYEVNYMVFIKLQNDENHKKAEEFQTIIDHISKSFNILSDYEISNKIINTYKLKFNKYAEYYFFNDFVNNIENEEIIASTKQLLIKYAKQLIKQLENVTTNPLKYAQMYKYFAGRLNKLKESNKNE